MYACVPHACSAYERHMRAPDSLELELQLVASCCVGAENQIRALNHRASLQALRPCVLSDGFNCS